MIGYALLALAAATFLVWLAFWRRPPKRPAGLPEGKVVYCGIDVGEAPVLEAPDYGLRGMPDYIVRQDDVYIPVEVKSARDPKRLYYSVRMQVVAQALLVEARYGRLPTRGLALYPNRSFAVEIRRKDIDRLVSALEVMRDAKLTGSMTAVPQSWALCPTCPSTNCPKRDGDRRETSS